jgi:cell division protein FtsW (lipid II flippase)
MLIVIGLLSPLFVYVLVGAALERRVRGASGSGSDQLVLNSGRVALAGAFLVLLCTSAAVVYTVAKSAAWQQGAELVWTGVRSAQSAGSVRIGGARETATTQWPEGYAWPAVEIRPAADGKASVSTWGGQAFVLAGGQYVNGVEVAEKNTVDVGGFSVEHARRLVAYHHVRVRVANRIVIDRWLWLNTDSPFTLSGSANEAVVAMLATHDKAESALALRLETWTAQTQFVRQATGVLRVLEAETTPVADHASQTTITMPFDLDVRWLNRRLPTRITLTPDSRVRMQFRPPWRSGTPIPPDKNFDGSPTQLVVTSRPRPGDFAFRPPLGFAADDPRVTVPVKTLLTLAQQLRTAADDYLVPGSRRVKFESGELPESDLRIPLRVPGRPADSVTLDVHVVLNLLRWPVLGFILFVGLVAWMVGGILATRSLWHRDAWAICGIGLAAWILLSIRLLLAVRYALDPRHLDAASVNGVATAAGALVIVPAFLFATGRLWRDTFQIAGGREGFFRFWKVGALLLAVPALVAVQTIIVRQLWSDLPERLSPAVVTPQLLLSLVLVAIVVVHNYRVNLVGVSRSSWLTLPLHLPHSLVNGAGRRFWTHMSACGPAYFWKDTAVLGGLMFLCALLFGLASGVSATKAVQEIAAPLVLVWFSVAYFLGYRAAFSGGGRRAGVPWARAVILASVLVALPVYVVPVLMRDVGGVMAALAVFVPLVLVLALSRAWRPALAAGGVLVSVFGLIVWLLSMSVRPGPELPVGLFERGLSRYVVFRQGIEAQRYLPSAEVPTRDPDRVTARSLQGAIEHTWENAAMIHEGGVFGRGFDGAPNRRSMVPQTVLQFDSTFSFFIAAEHGAVGSAGLVALYLAPLCIVLWSSRRLFDTGHALATIIAASLFGEALVHIAANLGAVPFTGRNLPLLSVLSMSDLFRWTILFALMGQAVLWRASGGDDECSPKAESMLGTGRSASGESPFAIWLLRWVMGGAALAVVFFLLFSPIQRNLSSKQLESPFGWDEYLKRVGALITEGKVGWDDTKKEAFVAGTGWVLDGSSLLEQEVARFNALPDSEKYEESVRLADAIGGVTSLAAYDDALGKLRQRWAGRTTPRRPALFRLTAERPLDSDGEPIGPAWRIGVNHEYNVRLSFASANTASAVPTIRLTDTAQKKDAPPPTGSTPSLVVGPVWVNGRIASAVDERAPLSWAESLSQVMEHEWRRLAPADAAKRYGTLTLDRPLQNGAMDFVAERGRALHNEILQKLDARSEPRLALPPRVALSVVELPTGRVLAMGGWPRTAVTERWQRDAHTEEWLPPASWLEREAPSALRPRYLGDRNFDTIEMGSATKPIWAAAVLAVHPKIATQLRVRGFTKLEQEVYGIPINGNPWQVHDTGVWVDFSRYLTESDNRYQVRLGFAGLAEPEGGRLAQGGVSPSELESMAANAPVPWKRYPRFAGLVGFSDDTPKRLENVHQTPLAERLRTMFGISVRAGDRRAFYPSFWTGVEADEWPDSVTGVLATEPPEFKDLKRLSPPATQFGLDAFGVQRRGQATLSPRNFIDMLLGGGENRWANVEFAAAFATAVTGHTVVAHITPVDAKPATDPVRVEFAGAAALLRPGLAGVVGAANGTANGRFANEGAMAFIKSMAGVKAYAKTGTLVVDKATGRETSRLVLVLVRWKDERKGQVQSGLVLSMVAERAKQGTATTWLAKFLTENRDWIRARMK